MSFPSDLDFYEAINGPDPASVCVLCADCHHEFWTWADDPTVVCERCHQKREEFVYSDCNVRRA